MSSQVRDHASDLRLCETLLASIITVACAAHEQPELRSTLRMAFHNTTPGGSFTTHLAQNTCKHDKDPDLQHPDITPLTFTISTSQPALLIHDTEPIGFIEAQLLRKPPSAPQPTANQSNWMWLQCRAYDTAHSPEAKLHKVENYLSNECFHSDKQPLLDRAAWVLYVEKVFLWPAFRGRRLGLWAVDELIRRLELGESGIAMLEPGPVVLSDGEADWDDSVAAKGQSDIEAGVDAPTPDAAEDATEKIRRHWKRMGFAEWSYTDEAWLCLASGDRLRIEDVREAAGQGERAG